MIQFNAKPPVQLPSKDWDRVKTWLEKVALSYSKRVGEIAYLFCDDPEILRVNIEFLGHDYFTDIITFDYSRRHTVSGDIYISLDTVRSNAQGFTQNYDLELMRVIAHGLLHLCGINDKGPGERQIMEMHENQALMLLEGDYLNI